MNARIKHLKNQKGLTLIELLAVIVVLGIIAAIAVPSVAGVIERAKINADHGSYQIIKDAGLRYALAENVTEVTQISVDDLVTKGYLNEVPEVQSSKIENFGFIEVDLINNKYSVKVFQGTIQNRGDEITDATFEN